MMQHIATKRQDVAALPVSVEGDVASQPDTKNGAAFSEAFKTTDTHRNVARDDAQRNADRAAAKSPSGVGNDKKADNGNDAPDGSVVNKTDGVRSDTDHGDTKSTVADDTDDGLKLEETPSNAIAAQDEKSEAIDWLAYVEQIRELAEGKGSTGESSNAESGDPVTVDIATQPGQFDLTGTSLEELLNVQGAETRREQDKIPGLPDLIARLGQEMGKQSGSSGDTTQTSIDGDSSTLKQLAAAIVSALNKQGSGQQQEAEDGQNLDALLAQLKGVQNTNTSQSDVELLLSVIQGRVSEQNPNASDARLNAEKLATDAMGDKTLSLMENLVGLDKKHTDQMAQSVTERVADLVPTLSDTAKKQVADAIVAGMAEMKNQAEQGHEPGISLKAMVTDALQQADVNVTPALSQGIDRQLSQINSLLNAANTSSVAAVQAAQLVSPDTAIAENTQVRSETTAAGKQAEGFSQPVNIHQADGQKQLGEKIRWMVNSRNMMAEIRLDPPEMGSMQVRVNVQGDAASVSFVVQSQQARDALAQAEPRLKDMLAQQGIELGESSVQQHSSGQSESQNDGRGGFGGQSSGHADSDENTQVIEQSLTRQTQGGIDDYA